MNIHTMLKRFITAVLFLAVMSGASWATTINPDYRFNLYQGIADNTYANYLYTLYGDDTGFNYQLRELTGNNTAGPQWFATVYENYYYNLYNVGGNNDGNRSVYRRTMGGEIPEITISAVGNIIGGFNFMLLEEPQPYPGWTNVYDVYPDPMESLCLVIKNGTGNFNINFGNPYASHYPYWWHWTTTPGSRLWDNRARVNSINEPIAYIINTSSGVISELGTDGNYADKYTITLSTDLNASADIISYHYDVKDLEDNLIYITSGDAVIDVNDNNNVLYTVPDVNITGLNIHSLTAAVPDDTKIYNAAGNLAYTLESEVESNVRYIYVCDVRSVTESVRIDGFDEYSFTFNPRTEQVVNPGEYYSANVRLNSSYGTSDYGSTLGYITFNQRADLQRGYTRYREDTTIPLVIANVYDGNASEVPLQFDMTVYDSDTTKTAEHVVNRVKFTWNAQENMPDQDFGTFFMIRPSGQAMPTYYLETQITNRTGTRYRLYRYDMLGRTTGFQEILPAHWKYDLPLSPTELQRETLPPYFHLDAHSQIAPGLVTVYDHEVYGTVNTAYDTYESFRLSEYDSPNPKDLRLNYRRVGGMDLIEGTEETLGGVRTREFIMHFADVINNEDETVYELENLMGRPPVMINADVSGASFNAAAPTRGTVSHDTSVYINANAIDAFRFLKSVPAGLVTLITISDDESPDTPAPTPEPDNQQENANASIIASAVKQISSDIPLQPLSIRMRIPRQNSLIVDHWTEFENAETSTALFNAFARYGTVWLRSDSTGEMDANLFTAINSKGDRVGAGAADCVSAFLYDDELFLDFIVVLADSGSIRTGKTAFVEIFTDDGIPYILIGDGNENGEWDMTFYISATGENPTPRDNTTPASPDVRPVVSNDNSGGGGGGGCNLGLLGMFGALVLLGKIRRS